MAVQREERAAEHRVGGDSIQEDDTAAHTGENADVGDTGTRRQEKPGQRQRQTGSVPHIQSDLSRFVHARNGKPLLGNLREKKVQRSQARTGEVGSWQLAAKDLRYGPAIRVCLLEKRWFRSFGEKSWGGASVRTTQWIS